MAGSLTRGRPDKSTHESPTMAVIDFSKEEKEILVRKLRRYTEDELDCELSTFEVGFLLDFITDEIGPYFYNQGLYDARAVVASQLERVDDAIYEIEKPTEFTR